MKRRSLLTLWLALTLGVVTLVSAQELAQREVGVRWQDGVPRVSFSAHDLVTPTARHQLESGLRKQFVVTVQAYREHGGSPLATRRFACSVYWDVWEEVYWLRLGNRPEPMQRLEAVLTRCLDVREIAVGRASDYEGRSGEHVYFAVRAEFNPVSAAQCRALLRPGGGAEALGPVVINIVRRQICQAESAVSFRSASEAVP